MSPQQVERRVQFNDEVDVQSIDASTTTSSQDEQEALFYSRQQIRDFRSSFQRAAQSLEQDDAGDMMARLHQSCRRGSFDEADLEQELAALQAEDKDAVVGLEHVACNEIRQTKAMQLEEMMDRIQEIQDSVYDKDDDNAAEEIRAACERISRPSRRFATRLAKVSATAA